MPHRLLASTYAFFLLGWLGMVPEPARANSPVPLTVDIHQPDLTGLHALAPGSKVQVLGLRLTADAAPVVLQLEAFSAWKEGARITVLGARGAERRAPTPRSHFHGRVMGDHGSWAFLALGEDGSLRGLLVSEGRFFVLDSHLPKSLTAGEHGLRRVDLRQVDLAKMHAGRQGTWSCATDALEASSMPDFGPLQRLLGTSASFSSTQAARVEGSATLVGDVAIETDWEFFDLLGSESAASDYVSDLIAAVASIFLRDINARPQISDLYLYTEGPTQDPWSAGDVVNAAFEVRDYWMLNRPDVERSVVHFLPGRFLGGGVAWVGSLCDNVLGYGVTGEVTGTFDPADPTIVSDLFVLAHELGHSFGSPHTHCYNNVPMTGDPPIDMCWGSENGCYQGSTSVPATGGSIMSYCSLGSGGLDNVSLWLGREGFYGERSERVNETMRAYLESVASCLPENTSDVFRDGFEAGNTSTWSSATSLN